MEKPPLHALTGLRIVAAVTVFVHHLGGRFGFEINRYSIGSLAVTFFFVLSGFILTYVYQGTLENRQRIKRFFFARFARIWPLHCFCLIASIVLVALDQELRINNWLKLPVNAALLQSWVPFSDWVFSFNSVSWSISTEAFFYALFPLLMIGGGKNSAIKIILAMLTVVLAGVAVNNMAHQHWMDLDYYRIGHVNPLVRLPEFCCGMVTCMFFLRQQHPNSKSSNLWIETLKELLVIVALVGLCYWVTNQRIRLQIETSSWGSEFLGSWFRVIYPAGLMAIAIWVFARSSGLITKLLSWRPIVYLGDVSYAFYMVHFLVLRTISRAGFSYGELTGFQLATLAFVVSLGLSTLLFELIEIPTKHRLLGWYDKRGIAKVADRPNKKRHGAWARVLVAMVLTACAVVVLRANCSDSARPPEVASIVEDSLPNCRNVRFGGDVQLLGCRVTKQTKRLKLEFAWVKRVEIQHRRLVFVFDQEESLIARGMHNQVPFENAEPGVQFVDTVYLPFDRMKNASQVVVCFRRKGKRPLAVWVGSLRQPNNALVLFEPEQFNIDTTAD